LDCEGVILSIPSLDTKWVPVWPLSDPPMQLPTPISGRWLKGGAGGAMSWEIIPGIVAADTQWHIIGGAGEPAFVNGWQHYPDPYGPGRFRKLASGLVVLEGLIRSGTVSLTAFTMPVGYRPAPQVGGAARDHIFQLAVGGGISYEAARIDSTGAFRPTAAASSSWIALNGVTYYAG
jgi:hypothetical protein